MNSPPDAIDPQMHLRSLHMSLLTHQEHFDEFRRLLALYPDNLDGEEPPASAAIRHKLNEQIREWIGPFEGLNAAQTLQWRAMVVDERFNISSSP